MNSDQLIIVTGGAGFIGSGIVRYLNDRGFYNIIIADDLGTDEKWKNLVGKRFIDLIAIEDLFDWLDGNESVIDAFIHLGACSDTMETDADHLLDHNYRYSVGLAEYAIKNNHRFIYASSAATYGDGSHGFKDDDQAIFELEPLNMYGFSKQLFDQWLITQGLLDKVVGLKYFNVFGPNEAHKGRMASAITRMVPCIQSGKPVQLFKSSDPAKFGDGEQKRDFLYVKDAARMTCAFLENDVTGIFNIGSGVPSTWNELTKAVYKAMGLPPAIEYIDMPANLIGKYQNYSMADMNKTKETLGDIAICSNLEDSVKDYVCNYLVPDKKW